MIHQAEVERIPLLSEYSFTLHFYIVKKVCKLCLFTDYLIQGRELKYAVKSTQILNVGTFFKIQAIPIFKTALKFSKQTQFSLERYFSHISWRQFGNEISRDGAFVHTLSDPTLISVLAA